MWLWWWWWLLFLFLLFLLPVGYGVGYRRWGPPYPSYYRRRRAARAGTASADAGEWGLLADIVWIALLVSLVWLVFAAV